MIVSDRRRRLEAQRTTRDIEPGDFVRQLGWRGVGIVESVENDHAVVAWGAGTRSILPLVTLRKARGGGHDFDVRRT